jgi:Protein of unknown function (DUF2905)
METAGKVLLVAALLLAVAGGIALLLARVGVDRLPGDLVFRRGNVTVWAPIGTMILVSVVLTILLNLWIRR